MCGERTRRLVSRNNNNQLDYYYIALFGLTLGNPGYIGSWFRPPLCLFWMTPNFCRNSMRYVVIYIQIKLWTRIKSALHKSPHVVKILYYKIFSSSMLRSPSVFLLPTRKDLVIEYITALFENVHFFPCIRLNNIDLVCFTMELDWQ